MHVFLADVIILGCIYYGDVKTAVVRPSQHKQNLASAIGRVRFIGDQGIALKKWRTLMAHDSGSPLAFPPRWSQPLLVVAPNGCFLELSPRLSLLKSSEHHFGDARVRQVDVRFVHPKVCVPLSCCTYDAENDGGDHQ